MKSIRRVALASVFMAVAGVASAAQVGEFGVTGDVHLSTSNHFRGAQFSAGEPSIGFKLNADHASGVFGSLSSDSVKLGDLRSGELGKERNQLHNVLSVGYATAVKNDVVAGVSLDYHAFTGQGSVTDLSFAELTAFVKCHGLSASVSRNISGADVNVAGFNQRDTYAQVGYTHQLNGKVSVGGNFGYSMYGSKSVGATDGVSVASVFGGYKVNDQVALRVTYQTDLGETAMGDKATGNKKAYLQAQYSF